MKTLIIAITSLSILNAEPVPLFDGKSLDGWHIREGEKKWWRAEDGMIIGGSLTETLPFNSFLASKNDYENFDLSFKIQLVNGEGFVNSGMQVQSTRADGKSEMIGYQVDAGPGYWGDLYDESRRNTAIAKSENHSARDWEWNEYRILCEGPRIRTWINGTPAIDFTEQDSTIPLNGRLATLTPEVEAWIDSPDRSAAELAEGLAILREIGSVTPGRFLPMLDHPDDKVRREAVIGFSSINDTTVVADLFTYLNTLQ